MQLIRELILKSTDDVWKPNFVPNTNLYYSKLHSEEMKNMDIIQKKIKNGNRIDTKNTIAGRKLLIIVNAESSTFNIDDLLEARLLANILGYFMI